jgi:hypothetical protein
MSKKKISTIKELLLKFEEYGTVKEVIEKLSEKYEYKKQEIKDEIIKDEILKELEELKKESNNDKIKEIINKYSKYFNDIENDIDYSKQGFLYERIWDICIKFGLVKNIIDFDNYNNPLLHFRGNVNKNDIIKLNCKEFKNFFYDYLKEKIISGNSGGYSDITIRNNDIIVISSCKYFKDDKENDIKKYEIHNLCPIINKNTDPVKIVLFLKDKKTFIKKNKTANKSSQLLIKYINPYGNYENVYDLNDLEFYYSKLKNILKFYNYFKDIKDIKNFEKNYLKHYKKIFEPKFHQHLFINQISRIISNNNINKNILIGAIPRTGKTYILAGSIEKYISEIKKKEYNFIIITPAPTETIPQYIDVFNNYSNFNDINIITKDKDNNNKHKKDCINVYIYSKQKLDRDDKKGDNDENIIHTLRKYDFSIIFIDEAHYGMTTDKSKELLKALNEQKQAFKIFITATYNKPIREFDIPKKQMLYWSLDNVIDLIKISNMNDITHKHKNFKNFIENIKKDKCFDEDIIDDVLINIYKGNIEIILNQYKNFPQPYLLTTVWKNTDDIYNEIRLANGLDRHTFTMDSIFNLNKDNTTFENENDLIELFHYYYGYPRKKFKDENENTYDVNYDIRRMYKEYGIIPRIRNVCQNDCRTLQEPLNTFNPTTQLWFLPKNDNKLENKIPALLLLLKNNFQTIYNKTLFIVAISDNSKNKNKNKNKYEDNNVKYCEIKDDIIKVENENKVAKNYLNIVILTGFKFNLGVSFPNVDIVVLFNNSRSSDLIYQMMFRSMTDINDDNDCLPNNSFCHKKKYGFIVDLNPQRTIEITNYIKSNIINNPKSDNNEELIKVKYMDLLNVDRDFFKNKYDIDDDNNTDNKEDLKNYTKEYFKKLALYFKETADNIFYKLKNYNFDFNSKYLSDIDKILKDVNFNDTKKNKEIITKEGIDEILKIKERIKTEQPDKKDADIEKEAKKQYDNIEKIKLIISELMVILPIITDMNFKCVLDNNDDINILKKELIYILNIIKSNIKLHDIFIDYVIDRCKIAFKTNDFNEYYSFFIELINNLNNNIKSNMKLSCPKSKESEINKSKITKILCQKWMENKLLNPVTKRKIKDTSPIYKNLKSKCAELLSNNTKKGGNNSEMMNYINDTMTTISTKLNNINNPKELLDFLNANLKPTQEKKEKNGEVFTPIKLIEEMMDKLTDADPNIWSNPNLKWLDPAAGMGNFAVVVYLRLMEGLKKQIPNIEERKKHILENMLYMVEYDRTNSFMMSKIFCGNKYKLNIFTGSFIEDERYEKEGIDIFSLDETKIKKYKYKNYAEENKRFSRNINTFGGKFDIIMGNPPYNSGGILAYNHKKNTTERKVIWDDFIDVSFKILKDNGYFIFINPLYWLKSTDKLNYIRNILLEKHIIWLLLWDNSKSKEIINGDIPLSIYLIHNTINKNKNKTEIVTISKRRNINKISHIYLDKNYTIPLAFHNLYIKLLNYITINNLQLEYFTKTVKSIEEQFKLPSKYTISDMYAVDTFRIKEGILVKKALSIHPDLNKNKLIIANKSGFNGIFIDNGRLALTGNKKYYILGDKLELILKLLKFKIFNIICQFTKYEQDYLDSVVFKYIPDIRKLGIKDITEDAFYKLIKLTKDEIDEIKNFIIKDI